MYVRFDGVGVCSCGEVEGWCHVFWEGEYEWAVVYPWARGQKLSRSKGAGNHGRAEKRVGGRYEGELERHIGVRKARGA